MALATSLSSSLKVCIKELNVQLSFQIVLLHSLTLMLAFVKGVILVRCYLTFLPGGGGGEGEGGTSI